MWGPPRSRSHFWRPACIDLVGEHPASRPEPRLALDQLAVNQCLLLKAIQRRLRPATHRTHLRLPLAFLTPLA